MIKVLLLTAMISVLPDVQLSRLDGRAGNSLDGEIEKSPAIADGFHLRLIKMKISSGLSLANLLGVKHQFSSLGEGLVNKDHTNASHKYGQSSKNAHQNSPKRHSFLRLKISVSGLVFCAGLYLFLYAFVQFERRAIVGDAFAFYAISGIVLMVTGAILVTVVVMA